ncbi:dephospho-CoA kinase [Vagococcus intermedius]|uniref:Dephospho-CoA kinase n=1 Tax=Vagococcus intermedius TaxID=2991418 RepID=A0AAF0CTK9_9ENTE|nr:dephospho-CoA kinase [Vagococcus intermedius]WEG72698.1 dephospho-CoA kinase [Vagococcus intermedius]WEG74783.1 dephospho-CoA kinase [Vagococcus intermedius]
MSFVLGVTGSIATGKSTVTKYLRDQGFAIIDADQVAREVVQAGTPGLAAIVTYFGEGILTKERELDRQKLGTIIFSDETKRQELDTILKGFIRTSFMKKLAVFKQQKEAVIVCDIPLLYEAGYDELMDRVMVVYVPEVIQCQRLMARDQLTEVEARKRMASQMSIEDKKKRADIIIDNGGSRANTYQQVAAFLKEQ